MTHSLISAADELRDLPLADLRAAGHWQARYKLLMDWGKQIAPKPAIRTEANAVRGCETALWLSHAVQDGRHYFAVDGESRIIKGLAALLLAQVNGRTGPEIDAMDLTALVAGLGLTDHLSPSRNNGLRALISRLEALAALAC